MLPTRTIDTGRVIRVDYSGSRRLHEERHASSW